MYTNEIQPTMARTVEWLTQNGFKTTDSGDGILNVEADMEGAVPYAHVRMVVSKETLIREADRLKRLVEDHGICIEPIGLYHNSPAIQASYDPADEIGILELVGVKDSNLFSP